jgi:hypothetical protein
MLEIGAGGHRPDAARRVPADEDAVGEPGTLAYRWFQDSGVTGNYVVIEEYVDDDAAMTHNDNAADLLARVADCAELAAIEIHGPAGPRILTWADGNPLVTLHPELSG